RRAPPRACAHRARRARPRRSCRARAARRGRGRRGSRRTARRRPRRGPSRPPRAASRRRRWHLSTRRRLYRAVGWRRARVARRRSHRHHRLHTSAAGPAGEGRVRVRRLQLLRDEPALVAVERDGGDRNGHRPPERLQAELRRREVRHVPHRGDPHPTGDMREGQARVLEARVAIHVEEAAPLGLRRERDPELQVPEAEALSAVRVERDGGVLRVTLARPDRRNAFDAQLIAELAETFVDVGRAHAVVLAGEGPSFCAGADVEWMRASVGLSLEENVADANAMRQMFEAIDGCPAPVVARVQGHALGAGAGLVAAADIAIAEPGAVFAFSEVKLGIIPAVISPFTLTRIGPGAARRYFLTGERFDASTALRIGLVSEVAEDLDAAVERAVGELRSAGPRAARW